MDIDDFFTQCNTSDTNNTPKSGGRRIHTVGGRRKPANTSNIKDSTSLVSSNLHLQPKKRSNNAPISIATIANCPPNSSTALPHRTHKHGRDGCRSYGSDTSEIYNIEDVSGGGGKRVTAMEPKSQLKVRCPWSDVLERP